jgi:plasmid replication initiation protein
VHELKKHAAIIHCSNPMSLLQRKISNALLYHAYHKLLQEDEHEISIRQLCNLIEYNGNNHAVIKDALRGLLSTVIEWNVVNDTTGSEDWTASSILASVSLRGPTCLYAYSPRMKALLHSPSMFGKINLYVQSRFKSNYGLALYENCIRYRGLPYTKWFDMETFRKLMGVPADNYTIFRDFKRRVLDKSIEEVNTYSDLLVEVELARERRQVVKLRFALKERAKKTRLGTALNNEEALLEIKASDDMRSRLIVQFGLSPRQAEQIIEKFSTEFINEKILLIEASKNYQQGKVQNLAAYLMSSLKNNYLPAKKSHDSQIEKKKEDTRRHLNLREIKRLTREVEEAYTTYREELIDSAILLLQDAEKTDFMQKFREHAAVSIKTILKLQRKKYTMETVVESPQVKALLRQFALQQIETLYSRVVPIEKFLENFSEKHQEAWYQVKLSEHKDIAVLLK